MFAKIKENVLEMFFPSHCVLCEKLGTLLCGECAIDLFWVGAQACPFCNKLSERGRVCSSCRGRSSLSGVVSALYFKDDLVKDVLHPYKYEGLSSLAPLLTEHLSGLIRKEAMSFDVVAYVPTTRSQESKRGYNQSKLLAELVAEEFGRPLFGGLAKKTKIKSQVGLPRKERFRNMQGAFTVRGECSAEGKKVLLIDDVITTGATLNGCAMALRRAGAREVWAATLAKE